MTRRTGSGKSREKREKYTIYKEKIQKERKSKDDGQGTQNWRFL
jgi:hypothetical protein